MMGRLHLHIDPSMVYFLRFILEGYDNLFVLSTIDSKKGLVEIIYVENALNDLQALLDETGNFIGLVSNEDNYKAV